MPLACVYLRSSAYFNLIKGDYLRMACFYQIPHPPSRFSMLQSLSVDDAEKGLVSPASTSTLATLAPSLNSPPLHGSGHIDGSSEKVSTSTETKSLDLITAHSTAVQSSRLPPAKSARRKTSRWIRFQLWFNTYRYVVPSPDPLRNCHLFFFMSPENFLR